MRQFVCADNSVEIACFSIARHTRPSLTPAALSQALSLRSMSLMKTCVICTTRSKRPPLHATCTFHFAQAFAEVFAT